VKTDAPSAVFFHFSYYFIYRFIHQGRYLKDFVFEFRQLRRCVSQQHVIMVALLGREYIKGHFDDSVFE
jgi:hypothetical protein